MVDWGMLRPGFLVTALLLGASVLRIPEPPLEPRPFREARRKAQALADLLKPRIPALTVTLQGVPQGAAPDLTVDGVAVPLAEIGVARKVDPGHHVVVATTDLARGSGEIDLREGETKELTIALVPVPGAKPKAAATTLATISDIAFALAVAGAGLGVYGLLSTPKAEAAPVTGMRVTPILGPRSAGIAGTF
jgi:hypothetical protein